HNYTHSRDGAQQGHGVDVVLKRPKAAREPMVADIIELRFGQVLANLVDNAVSFSKPGSTVTLSIERASDDVEISVEDMGPGIRPENLETIFKRFYTDRPEPDAFGKNSGLGLSISRQIMQALGGSLDAENATDESGQTTGARFIIRLPAR
ncbi:MAG: ATP-binding protein, partial [Candidatus Phaeomarinobacter sp.]